MHHLVNINLNPNHKSPVVPSSQFRGTLTKLNKNNSCAHCTMSQHLPSFIGRSDCFNALQCIVQAQTHISDSIETKLNIFIHSFLPCKLHRNQASSSSIEPNFPSCILANCKLVLPMATPFSTVSNSGSENPNLKTNRHVHITASVLRYLKCFANAFLGHH